MDKFQNRDITISIPKKLWWYIGLWIFYIYLFIQIIQFKVESNQNLILAALYVVEFGVHEVSHILTSFFPPVVTALAGSFGEISFTILIIVAALRERSYYAVVFGLLWFMLAMNSVGRYIADARSQALPLVGPGETVKHDWNFILGQWGLLEQDQLIGNAVITIGNVVGFLGLALGLWVIIRLFKD